MGDKEQTTIFRSSNNDHALFFGRMCGIGKGDGERIIKYTRRFLERDIVFGLVAFCFDKVPIKLHFVIMPQKVSSHSKDCNHSSHFACRTSPFCGAGAWVFTASQCSSPEGRSIAYYRGNDLQLLMSIELELRTLELGYAKEDSGVKGGSAESRVR